MNLTDVVVIVNVPLPVFIVGAPGTVMMTAPLPALEKLEVPYTFVAETIAWMLLPHAMKYGEPLKILEATVHLVEVITDSYVPLQKDVAKYEPSLF
jgi:hypothetical protein